MFLAIPFLIGLKSLALRNFELAKKRKANFGKIAYILGLSLIGTKSYISLFPTARGWRLAVALAVIFWLKYSKIRQKKYLAIFAIILLVLLGLGEYL